MPNQALSADAKRRAAEAQRYTDRSGSRDTEMLAITIIVVSFIAVVLGTAHSHVAKPDDRSYKGLTRLGLTLVLLASLGMVFGTAKEISGIRAAARLAKQEAERDQMLKEMHAVVVGVKAATTDSFVAEQLETLADRISAAASLSRESNFRS